MLRAVRQCHLDLMIAPMSERGVRVTGDMVADFVTQLVGDSRTESLYAIFLDAQQRLITFELIARGDSYSCEFNPGMIVQRAVDLGARSLILAHNHPSGDPTPSAADHRYVQVLSKACALFQITLIDNVIVAGDTFTSCRAQGLL